MRHCYEDIPVACNFCAQLWDRGKKVPGGYREGHNVFTTTGKSWLAKLVTWHTITSTDVPYTQRRVRWMGVGTGTQAESQTVPFLAIPALVTGTSYLAEIQSVEFPTTGAVTFIKEFGAFEISYAELPVSVTEMALYADVSPAEPGTANAGEEDTAYAPGTVDTVLSPAVGTNPPIAYKLIDPLTKTSDFVLEVKWTFQF